MDDLYELLLEGWRMSALLLDSDKSKIAITWRQCVLTFMQCDTNHRGWLNHVEVVECEQQLHNIPDAGVDITPPECTSLGAFVLRAMHVASTCSDGAHGRPQPKSKLGRGNLKEKQKCLNVVQNAFRSIEKSLAVYLTGLMHSEELKDVALYRSLKTWLFGYRQAMTGEDALGSAHHLRSLILLLLAHQVDFQSCHQMVDARRLDLELRSLLVVLQKNWQARAELQGEDDDDDRLEDPHGVGYGYSPGVESDS